MGTPGELPPFAGEDYNRAAVATNDALRVEACAMAEGWVYSDGLYQPPAGDYEVAIAFEDGRSFVFLAHMPYRGGPFSDTLPCEDAGKTELVCLAILLHASDPWLCLDLGEAAGAWEHASEKHKARATEVADLVFPLWPWKSAPVDAEMAAARRRSASAVTSPG